MTDIDLLQHIEKAEGLLADLKHEVLWGRKYEIRDKARRAAYHTCVVRDVINVKLCHCKKPVDDEGKCSKCGYGYGGMPM